MPMNFFGLRNRRRPRETEIIGAPGTQIHGGYLTENETDRTLTHRQKYRVFSEALVNCSIVAASVRYFTNLVGGATWTVQASPDDVNGEYADLVESILFEDMIERRWPNVVKRLAMYRFYGFAIFERTVRKREDGITTLFDLGPRPQNTIEKWDMDKGILQGVSQLVPQDSRYVYMPRSKLVYIKDDSISDNPDGLGLFRQVIAPVRRLWRYEQLENIGYDGDLRGVPVGRAPYGELNEIAAENKGNDDLIAELKKSARNIETFVTDHVKSPNQGIILDSAVHSTMDATGRPSSIYKYSVDLLQGSSTSIPEILKSIDRCNLEIARVLGTEIMILGNGEGSHALANQKADQLTLTLNDTLNHIQFVIKRDVLRPLWIMNGFDERLMPKLEVAAANNISVGEMTAAIRDLAQAGAMITPIDEINNFIRARMGAPMVDMERIEADSMIGHNGGPEMEDVDDLEEIQ